METGHKEITLASENELAGILLPDEWPRVGQNDAAVSKLTIYKQKTTCLVDKSRNRNIGSVPVVCRLCKNRSSFVDVFAPVMLAARSQKRNKQ